MKNIRILMLIMGVAVISACASNEANMDTGESSAEMTNEQPAVAIATNRIPTIAKALLFKI